MSALSDLSAALLPPELGGPPPERVAAVTRRMLDDLPVAVRVAVAGGLVGLELAALARLRTRLGTAAPEDRARLLAEVSGLGPSGAASVDGLKALILLAWGAETYADEIAQTANAHEPVRPDGVLDLVSGTEWPETARCDALVIGSGAGGAFAARELARAGHDVVVLEEGEHWGVERIRRTPALERFRSLYRDGGATFALGPTAIALPLGRAVGGTTVVNSGTCYRPPAPVAAAWARDHGLDLARAEELAPRLADVEQTIGVGPVPMDVMGRNGRLVLAGAEALGWQSGPLQRNAPGCRGACQCSLGCPNNAKQAVHHNALPQACESGARVVAGLRAERVLVQDGQAVGALVRRRDGSTATISAGKVVVACGAIETPTLLRRSGLGGHPRTGRGLSIHPALGAIGSFEEPVVAWHGVLQSAGIEELHEREGVLLEATSTPPGMGAMVMPGIGEELVRRLASAEHSAALGAMIADEPAGRVVGAKRPLILYRLTKRDRGRLRVALGAIGRVLLAAGAKSVELGASSAAVRRPEDLDRAVAELDVSRLRLAAFHPTGTVAAGSDPSRHPAGPDGTLRSARSLWVADGSILPSCPGVNPQISIMALAIGVGNAAASA